MMHEEENNTDQEPNKEAQEQGEGQQPVSLPEEKEGHSEPTSAPEPMSKEEAQKLVDRWLKSRKITGARRDSLQGNIDELVIQVQDGFVEIEEDGPHGVKLKQHLRFPLQEGKMGQLVFKNRFSQSELDRELQSIDMNNGLEVIRAYVAVLTGEVRGLIKKLDAEDWRVGQNIVGFFT